MPSKNKSLEDLLRQKQILRDKIDAINKTIHKLEKKDFGPKIKQMVGKYYVYQNNSYSCPETQEDYWDVYRYVIDVVEILDTYHVIYLMCEIDCNKKVTIALDSYPMYNLDFCGYVETTDLEFNKAYSKALDELCTAKDYIECLKGYENDI